MTDRLQILAARMATISRTGHAVPVIVQQAEPAKTEPPALLGLREAAEYFSVSVPTFLQWKLPRFQTGRVVRYRRSDLEAFTDDKIGMPKKGG